MKRFKRGEIYYVERYAGQTGSEQYSGRLALIVSNDKNNEYSDVLEVVYLTTQPKKDLPTHVTIRSTPKESIALCEQVTSVAVERIGDYYATANEREMTQIDTALLISLDLNMGASEAPAVTQKETMPNTQTELVKEVGGAYFARISDYERERQIADAEKKLIKVTAQLELYKELYTDLNDRFYGKAANGR